MSLSQRELAPDSLGGPKQYKSNGAKIRELHNLIPQEDSNTSDRGPADTFSVCSISATRGNRIDKKEPVFIQ